MEGSVLVTAAGWRVPVRCHGYCGTSSKSPTRSDKDLKKRHDIRTKKL
jgi:hypothetical protein